MQTTVRVSIDVAERAARTPRIMLLSDDAEWRATAGRVLSQEGYRIVNARHAGQALVESIRLGAPLDLLLTDAEQEQRRSDFAGVFRDHPEAALLQLRARPRTRDELLAAVRAVLKP